MEEPTFPIKPHTFGGTDPDDGGALVEDAGLPANDMNRAERRRWARLHGVDMPSRKGRTS